MQQDITYGDWKVFKRDDGEIHVIAEDVNGNAYFICNCGHTGNDEKLPYNKEAEANAKAMAQLPNMLLVCEWIMEDLAHGDKKIRASTESKVRTILSQL